jgi:hypothetical protein
LGIDLSEGNGHRIHPVPETDRRRRPCDRQISKGISFQKQLALPKCSGPMMVIERLSASQILRALTEERSLLDSSWSDALIVDIQNRRKSNA